VTTELDPVVADFGVSDACGFREWLAAQDAVTARAVLEAFRERCTYLCSHLDGDGAHGDHRFHLGRITILGRASFSEGAEGTSPLTLILWDLTDG